MEAYYQSQKLFSCSTWKYRVHKYGNIGKVSQFLLINLKCLNRRQSDISRRYNLTQCFKYCIIVTFIINGPSDLNNGDIILVAGTV